MIEFLSNYETILFGADVCDFLEGLALLFIDIAAILIFIFVCIFFIFGVCYSLYEKTKDKSHSIEGTSLFRFDKRQIIRVITGLTPDYFLNRRYETLGFGKYFTNNQTFIWNKEKLEELELIELKDMLNILLCKSVD